MSGCDLTAMLKNIYKIFALLLAAGFVLSLIPAKQADARSGAYYSIRAHGRRGWFQQIALSSPSPGTPAQTAVNQVSPALVSIYGYQNMPAPDNSPDNGTLSPLFRAFFPDQPAQTQVDAGSGFFVNPNGFILTANHVVADKTAVYQIVLADGSQHQAQVVYQDPVADIAILKISGGNYPIVQLGDSSQLQSGQEVLGMGNAFGIVSNSVSDGYLAPLQANITSQEDVNGDTLPSQLFESSMQLYPGDSGGPTFDLSGKVVGINDAVALNSLDTSFSVPINVAKDALARVIANGA